MLKCRNAAGSYRGSSGALRLIIRKSSSVLAVPNCPAMLSCLLYVSSPLQALLSEKAAAERSCRELQGQLAGLQSALGKAARCWSLSPAALLNTACLGYCRLQVAGTPPGRRAQPPPRCTLPPTPCSQQCAGVPAAGGGAPVQAAGTGCSSAHGPETAHIVAA